MFFYVNMPDPKCITVLSPLGRNEDLHCLAKHLLAFARVTGDPMVNGWSAWGLSVFSRKHGSGLRTKLSQDPRMSLYSAVPASVTVMIWSHHSFCFLFLWIIPNLIGSIDISELIFFLSIWAIFNLPFGMMSWKKLSAILIVSKSPLKVNQPSLSVTLTGISAAF